MNMREKGIDDLISDSNGDSDNKNENQSTKLDNENVVNIST